VDFFIVFAWIGFDSLSYQIERGLFLRKLSRKTKKAPTQPPRGEESESLTPNPSPKGEGSRMKNDIQMCWDYSQPRITRIYTNDLKELYHHISRIKMLALFKLEKFDIIKN